MKGEELGELFTLGFRRTCAGSKFLKKCSVCEIFCHKNVGSHPTCSLATCKGEKLRNSPGMNKNSFYVTPS